MIDVRVSATLAVLRTTGASTLGGPGASEDGETRSARRSSCPAYFCRLRARVAATPMAGSRGSVHLWWQNRHRGAEVLVAVMRDRWAAAAMTLGSSSHYLFGQARLFDDRFSGAGSYIYEERPARLAKGSIWGRGLKGIGDAILSALGI